MSARAALALLLCAGCSAPEVIAPSAVPVDPDEWPSYGHDDANTRTNPSEARISPGTVASLTRAWELAGPAVTSTPAVRDGVVYFGGWDGAIHARRVEGGTPVWATQVSERAVDASPLVTEALVYIGDGLGYFHALDRETGAVVWTVDLDEHPDAHIFGSPVTIDDLVVIGVAGIELAKVKEDYTFRGSVVGLDAATGAERWRVYTTEDDASSGAGVSVWSTPAVDRVRKLLFIGTGNTYEAPAAPRSDAMLAIRYETGEIGAWGTRPMPWPCFGGMAVANGVLFHGTTDGTLHALDVRDGTERFTDLVGDAGGGGPSISNGLVLMGHGFKLFYTGGVVEGGLVAYGLP